MSERIFTLFGEEIVPEQQIKAVSKSRTRKTKEIDEEEPAGETVANEEVVVGDVIADIQIPPVAAANEPAKITETIEPKELPRLEEIIDVIEVADQPARTVEKPVKAAKEPKEAKDTREPKAPANLPAEWEGEKQYYSIGEVAALFSVRTSHIRFWTNEFKLKVRTTRKGDRLFTPEQIKEIRAIHHLVKERGFTLTGAKTKLKAQNKLDVETVDLKQSLTTLRNKLIIIKNQLVA